MSDLAAVAAEFKKWKGSLSYCRYPDHLWEKVYALTDRYPLKDIASALGIRVANLKSKFANRKPITFASVQISPLPASVKIEFKHMTLHVQEHQVISILQALAKEI